MIDIETAIAALRVTGAPAWRLFNAATLALSGKVSERPALTQQLHKVIDGVCETVH
jgi:hypothetical protein